MHIFNAHLVREAAKAGGHITDVAFCPHHEEKGIGELRKDCEHRKPRPGMLLWLAKKWNLDLGASVMIGDSPRDLGAAKAAGCHGWHYDGGDLHALAEQVIARHFSDASDTVQNPQNADGKETSDG